MSTSYSPPTRTDFAIAVESYLAELPDGGGAGTSLRGEALYAQIREARHEDDASLPMGEWERPLAKADWKTVAALSGDALRTRSKDFQLAAWLCEAWTHLHQIDGFVAGVEVMTGLIERYWETAWPQLEEGDAEVRAAPFAWFARTIARVLSLHVPLMEIDLPDMPAFNLEAFQRLAAAPAAEGGDTFTRELADTYVTRGDNLVALAWIQQRAIVAREAWDRLARLADLALGEYAPGFQGVAEVLTRLSRAATSLIGEREVHVSSTSASAIEALDDALGQASREDAQPELGPMQPHAATQTMATALPPSIVNLITDRAHAYRLLADVARYLRRQEPHSPTSYLLDRAISWESMTPADLMRDIVQPDGSVERYFLMLRLE